MSTGRGGRGFGEDGSSSKPKSSAARSTKTPVKTSSRSTKKPSSGRKPPGEMDPFEVRIRFSQSLSTLNASVTSSQKTAQYAIKYKEMDEDLHNCVIETLERHGNSMNNRANIMYFLEHLCDMAARENHHDYIRMIQRDIMRIVDAVAPDYGSGAANVRVVRKVLQSLEAKSYLLAQTVTEIDEVLREREHDTDGTYGSSPLDTPNKSKASLPGIRSDKKQVEQRIEEDRERHKRARENVWAVAKPTNTPAGTYDEFDKLWDETSDVGEDDFELYREEAEERDARAKEWKETYRAQFTS